MADSVKIKITGDDSEFSKTLSGLGNKTSSVFKGMLGAQVVTKGISMLTNGLKSAINTGMQFEASMSQVAAISGATGQELELLTETAKHYGETTMFSASQAAEALNYMALAGWDAQQSVDALGGVLDLAAASGMDLGRASDAVTDYLSAFSMEASQAGYMADLMAYAQSKSNTSASQLADAYGNCASTMNAAGQDIETTTAMLMALANQGIKGSEAGTQMAAVMRDLTQKMEEGHIMIGRTAVAVQDADGNFRDLNDIMADVAAATAGMGTAEKSAALMETFTARSVKAVNTILNEGLKNVDQYEEALRGSTGTAAEQAEIMMDNLQGDVQIFRSALEGLQITASESTNGIARSLVQEATGILDAINQAGKTGGLGGMADALLGQIPKLLPKVTKGVQELLGGLGKRLPGLVKGLFASLPDIFVGAMELAPSLIESLAGGLGAAAEGLITNLPRMVPTLVKGIGNMLMSVGKGAVGIVEGIFSGLDKVALSVGLRDMRLDEVLAEQFARVDMDRVRKLAGSVGVEYTFEPVTIDTEAYTQALTGAMQNIRDAIDEITGISDADKLRIKSAILSGSGASAVTAALNALNVPKSKISEVTSSLESAFETINATLSGLELSDTQVKSVLKALAAGEDIKASLMSFGIDPDTAGQVAGDLTQSMQILDSGLSEVGIDSSAIISFAGEATIDKFLIAAALNALKVDAGTVTSVSESYDSIDGTLASKISGAFESLKAGLVNGIPDKNDEEFAAAKKKVQDFFDEAYGVVDEWEASKIRELEESGLTGEDLQSRINEITAEAQGMRDELVALAGDTDTWVEANAGAAKETVKEHFTELDALLEKVLGIDAKIAETRDAVSVAGNTNRRAVEQGLVTDQLGQLEAFNYTEQELQHALMTARDKSAKLLEEAGEKFADDTKGEEYARRRAEIMEALAEEVEAAYSNYDNHMERIVDGMLRSSPEYTDALAQYKDDLALKDSAERLVQGISDAMNKAGLAAASGESIDPLQWFQDNVALSESDYAAIAEGLGIDPDQLWTQISNTLKQGTGEGFMTSDDFHRLLNPEQNLANALSSLDLSGAGSAFETLTVALQNGYMQASEDVDWTNIPSVIQTGLDTMVKDLSDELNDGGEAGGESLPEGVATGIANGTGQATDAANDLGADVIGSLDDSIGHHSPSTMGQEAGESIPEGVAVGIKSGESAASAAAQGLGKSVINATKSSIPNTRGIGLQFSIGLAGGILSGRSAVVSAAITVAQAAANAVRSTLQIHSPSRVTEGFGEYFDLGLMRGIDRNADSVVRSAVRMANSVAGAANLSPQVDFSGLSASMNGAIGDLADIESNRDIALYLNGREMARASTQDYNTALNGYARRIRMGYGRG